jgi:uracil-DNA glycosylase family 4
VRRDKPAARRPAAASAGLPIATPGVDGGRRFDPGCTRCRRLADNLAAIRLERPLYHARPVPAFGVRLPRLLIVGLAPGMHGANRTGRPFTGDHAGILLYATLHQFGFATRPVSTSAGDGLLLRDCRITNAVRCLPPQNKPTPAEVRDCVPFLTADIAAVPAGGVVLALGALAHGAVLRALSMRPCRARFAHAARHALPGGRVLLDSYHCSRYNTQTRRLTPVMFAAVFADARHILAEART